MAYNPLLFDAVDDQTILRVTNEKLVIDHNAMRVLEIGSHGITEYPYWETSVHAVGPVLSPLNTVRLLVLGPLRILHVENLPGTQGAAVAGLITYDLNALFAALGGTNPTVGGGCTVTYTDAVRGGQMPGFAKTSGDGIIRIGSVVSADLTLPAHAPPGAPQDWGHKSFVLMWVDNDPDTKHII